MVLQNIGFHEAIVALKRIVFTISIVFFVGSLSASSLQVLFPDCSEEAIELKIEDEREGETENGEDLEVDEGDEKEFFHCLKKYLGFPFYSFSNCYYQGKKNKQISMDVLIPPPEFS